MSKIGSGKRYKHPVIGYVRCGLSPSYGLHKDGRVAQYPTPSTCSFNSLFSDQRTELRRHARSCGTDLVRVFYDLEDPRPLELHERKQLVRLFVEINEFGSTTVLVAGEKRLSDDPLLAGLLLRYFLSRRIEVIDALSGSRLTSKRCAKERLAGRGEEEVSLALRLFRRFKGEVTRARNGSRAGRKAYGTLEQESRCLVRLRSLCDMLSRDQWKRWGGRVQTRRSFQEIANILNAEGYETRQGNPWASRTVQGIVKREWPKIHQTWWKPASRPRSSTQEDDSRQK